MKILKLLIKEKLIPDTKIIEINILHHEKRNSSELYRITYKAKDGSCKKLFIKAIHSEKTPREFEIAALLKFMKIQNYYSSVINFKHYTREKLTIGIYEDLPDCYKDLSDYKLSNSGDDNIFLNMLLKYLADFHIINWNAPCLNTQILIPEHLQSKENFDSLICYIERDVKNFLLHEKAMRVAGKEIFADALKSLSEFLNPQFLNRLLTHKEMTLIHGDLNP